MFSFITGSRRYGTPRDDSDLDLVIYCPNYQTERAIRAATGKKLTPKAMKQPVRFGNLNLIIVRTPQEWTAWYSGTEMMAMDANYQPKPKRRNKKAAKKFFDKIRKRLRIHDRADSGDDDYSYENDFYDEV